MEAVTILTLISILSLKLQLMDWKGVVAALPVGYLIYVFGGRGYFTLLLIFYLFSSLATKLRVRRLKMTLNEESSVRSWRNVVSNGLAAALASTASGFTGGSPIYSAAFLGALATAFADTLATEIGLLYPGMPRLITSMKKVKPGTPGAVSPLGYLAALIALGTLSLASIPTRILPPHSLTTTIFIPGLIGITIDSLMGATIQAKYRCPKCGKEIESPTHCGTKAQKISGTKPVNTHTVNLISTITGALAAALLIKT